MKNLRTLLIEDSENDATLIVRQLGKYDYRVEYERVETEEDFRRLLCESVWDVIIADYQLPEFNAPKALAVLQKSGLDIPFIVVSGAIGEETAVELMRSGASDYLMKSHLTRLGAAVSREVDEATRRRLQRENADLVLLQSAALNAAANAIVITDEDGIIEWVNAAFFLLTGYTSQEALGKNPRDLLKSGQHDPSFYQQLWDTILSGKVWRGELINRRKNGSIYIEEQTITPLLDETGKINRFIGIKQDITLRKQMEKSLQRYADAFSYCGHGIAVGDPKTNRIQLCNPAFAGMRGVSVQELASQPLLAMYAPHDHEMIKEQMDKADREGLTQFESIMCKEDGTLFPVHVNLVSVWDEKKKPIYRIATVNNISGRKIAEKKLLEEMEDSKRREKELELITMVSSNMRKAQTRSDLMEVILNDLSELMKSKFATLAFVEGGNLVFEDAVGNQHNWSQYRIPVRHPLFSKVLNKKQSIGIDLSSMSHRAGLPEWITQNCTQSDSVIIYPLISGQVAVGVILFSLMQATQLSSEQSNLVEAVAEMAGNAINRMLSAEKLEMMVQRREKELELIYQVTSAASISVDFQQAFHQALKIILSAVQAEQGAIYLLSEENGYPEQAVYLGSGDPESFERSFPQQIFNTVLRTKQATLLSGQSILSQNEKLADVSEKGVFIGLPMRISERVIGVVILQKISLAEILLEELTVLSFIADHLALVVDNIRLFKKAEQSAVLEERSRLARELHDSVTQSLYSASLYSVGALRYIDQGKFDQIGVYLNHIAGLTQQSLKDMRLLVYQLRSSELVKSGLLGAIQSRLDAVERRSGIEVSLQSQEITELPEQIEENLYWITIEALNNSIKHAQAAHLWIEIEQRESDFVMVIQDDGIGFDLDQPATPGGMGLQSMRERAERIGGKVEIRTSPGSGTCVEIRLAFNEPEGK